MNHLKKVYVNEEKGIVFCSFLLFDDNFGWVEGTGKAKCREGEVFDRKIGMALAEKRARRNATRLLAGKISEYVDKAIRQHNRLVEEDEKYTLQIYDIIEGLK